MVFTLEINNKKDGDYFNIFGFFMYVADVV